MTLRNYWEYQLTAPDGLIIFQGSDYSTPPAMEATGIVRGLIAFLTRQPEGTDPENFHAYTPIQWAFANSPDAPRLERWADTEEHTSQCRKTRSLGGYEQWVCADGCTAFEIEFALWGHSDEEVPR